MSYQHEKCSSLMPDHAGRRLRRRTVRDGSMLRKRGISSSTGCSSRMRIPTQRQGRSALREFSVTEFPARSASEPSTRCPASITAKKSTPPSLPYQRLRQLAAQQNTLRDGAALAWSGPVELRVLPAPQPALGLNDGSVVTRIRYGGPQPRCCSPATSSPARTALLSGDESLRADVLKAPHHCSRTNSTEPFVQAVAPRLVICSVDATIVSVFRMKRSSRAIKAGQPDPSHRSAWLQLPSRSLPSGLICVLPTNKARFFL